MMRLPKQLLREISNVHKNTFGHILILAGSKNMTGAAVLSSLAAMRSGAGLVTLGIPQSLNSVFHKKISPVIMTFPLKETKQQTLSLSACAQIIQQLSSFDVLAIGPGLSRHHSTQKFILKVISTCSKPLVIDADGLNALSQNVGILKKTPIPKILTPHPGEMARLMHIKKNLIEKNRKQTALDFSRKYRCTIVLKGHRTIVASWDGKTYTNTTGNAGMATAGSGDVLTGMIAAFLAQGLTDFKAAKYGVFLHGLAGDLAARDKTKISMIATDIIDHIPDAIKNLQRTR